MDEESRTDYGATTGTTDEKDNKNDFRHQRKMNYSSEPFCHRQQIDRLAQHGVNVHVDLIRELGGGMLQKPLSYCCRNTTLRQQRCKRLP